MSRIIKLEPWESTNYQQWDKCVKFLVVAIQCINKTNAYLEITLASIPPLNISIHQLDFIDENGGHAQYSSNGKILPIK